MSQDTRTLVSHNRILRAHSARLVHPLVLVDSVLLTGRFAFKDVEHGKKNNFKKNKV